MRKRISNTPRSWESIVVAYATGWDVKDKGERPKVNLNSKTILWKSHSRDLPKLKHGGGADDAPNAWRNVMSRFQFDRKRPVKLEKSFVSADIKDLQNYPIVFMHGRNAFKFSEKERAAIREYVQSRWIHFRGCRLFISEICSILSEGDEGDLSFQQAGRDSQR